MPCLLLVLGLLVPPDDVKKAVEDFRAALKAAATPAEKARLVRAFADLEPKDPAMVPPLAAALAPSPADVFLEVPSAAAAALARFHGVPAACRALLAAAEAQPRVGYLHRRVVLALGRVGHPAALPYLDVALGGSDVALAALAVEAIGGMSPPAALDKLIAEHDRFEARKNPSDAQKAVGERCRPLIEETVMRITGQPYPTFVEHKIWWAKHGAEFRKRWESKPAPPGPAGPAAPLLVELLFNDGAGRTAANGGVSGIAAAAGTLTPGFPAWDGTTAPNGGPSALEWDRKSGPHAVDLGGGAGLPQLKRLQSFTIAGWVLCLEGGEPPGGPGCGAGNRILCWLNPSKLEGVDLVVRGDGALQIGINEWAESSPARTRAGRIRVYDAKAADAGAELFRTWAFVAVTYDSTLTAGQLKFWHGWRGGDVALEASCDYNRGLAGTHIAPHLTAGNVPPQARSSSGRSFKGSLDDLRIWGSPRDGSGALSRDELVRIQDR